MRDLRSHYLVSSWVLSPASCTPVKSKGPLAGPGGDARRHSHFGKQILIKSSMYLSYTSTISPLTLYLSEIKTYT